MNLHICAYLNKVEGLGYMNEYIYIYEVAFSYWAKWGPSRAQEQMGTTWGIWWVPVMDSRGVN